MQKIRDLGAGFLGICKCLLRSGGAGRRAKRALFVSLTPQAQLQGLMPESQEGAVITLKNMDKDNRRNDQETSKWRANSQKSS